MAFCMNCGSGLPEHARFCGNCGTQAGVVGAAPGIEVPAGEAPMVSPAQASGPAAIPATQVFFSGDWAGAALAVAYGVGMMFGLALIAFLLMQVDSGYTEPSVYISGAAAYVALAAGGSVRAAGESLGADTILAFRPLGLTLVGFTLIAVVFAHRIRRRGEVTPTALGFQAGRTVVMFIAALLAVAFVGRVSSSGSNAESLGATMQVDVMSTVFFGVLTLAVALAVAVVIGAPGVVSARWERLRTAIAEPLRGTLITLAVACVLTLAGIVVVSAAEISQMERADGGSGPWRIIAGTVLLALPNIAGATLLFGLGVPVTGDVSASLLGLNSARGSFSILTLTDEDQRFWLWPLAIIVLLIISGIASARRVPAGTHRSTAALWSGGVLGAMLFILSLSLSAGAWASAFSVMGFGGSVGFDSLLALVYGGVWGFVIAFATLWAAPQRTGNALT